jgi:hypothetical protein
MFGKPGVPFLFTQSLPPITGKIEAGSGNFVWDYPNRFSGQIPKTFRIQPFGHFPDFSYKSVS